MPVNETLSTYSDWCYGAAVGVYVLAMLFSLVDQAFGRRVPRAVRARELVGAGAPAGPAESPGGRGARSVALADEPPAGEVSVVLTDDDPLAGERSVVLTDDPLTGERAVVQADEPLAGPADESPGGRWAPSGAGEPPAGERARRFGRMSVALTVLGVLLHLSALALRGIATERVPWGNMYEFGATLCLFAVITWLVVLRRFAIQHLSVWLLLPVIVLMFLGGVVLYSDAAPVQPALQSYWLVIHVFAIALGSGMVLVPGVVSVLYLLKVRRPALATRLPDATVLDQVAYRTTVFAFPIYTAGVIFGAIWAESAWGRFWDWDPKETVAFIAWIVYAAYLHSRATAGWRGVRAAVINIVGLATMVFNLFFINLVIAGLHSYAGV